MVKVRFLKMSAAGQTEWDPIVQGGENKQTNKNTDTKSALTWKSFKLPSIAKKCQRKCEFRWAYFFLTQAIVQLIPLFFKLSLISVLWVAETKTG